MRSNYLEVQKSYAEIMRRLEQYMAEFMRNSHIIKSPPPMSVGNPESGYMRKPDGGDDSP